MEGRERTGKEEGRGGRGRKEERKSMKEPGCLFKFKELEWGGGCDVAAI